MISVVIPLYNKKDTIAKTIECVLRQTYTDFEIVVVDDGSTDGSVSIVENIRDERIHIYKKENGGVSSARNLGIEYTKGEFIAFLDADDNWDTDYLNQQHKLATSYPDCDVYATSYIFRDHTGKETRPVFYGLNVAEGEDGVISNYFKIASCSHPPLWTSAIMVRRLAILSVGAFPVNASHGEDLLAWAKLACKYKIAFLNKPLAIYNLGAGFGKNSKPVNIPQGNVIGAELEKLLSMANDANRKDLRHYIGRWYKIRSHIFLRGGEKKNALVNILRTIKFRPKEWKIYVYLSLWPLPTSLINKIFKKLG